MNNTFGIKTKHCVMAVAEIIPIEKKA